MTKRVSTIIYGVILVFFHRQRPSRRKGISRIVVFTQKIKLKTGRTTVKGKMKFMVCTEEMCLPGEAVPFSLDVR